MLSHSLLLLIQQLLPLQLKTLTSKWPTNKGLRFPEGADLDAHNLDEFENDARGGFEPGVVWLTTARATD